MIKVARPSASCFAAAKQARGYVQFAGADGEMPLE